MKNCRKGGNKTYYFSTLIAEKVVIGVNFYDFFKIFPVFAEKVVVAAEKVAIGLKFCK